MKKYEGMFIIKPDIEEDKENKLIEFIQKSITKSGGKVAISDKWGKRRLAYPIKGQRDGVYYRFEFEIEPRFISDLKKEYSLKEDIVRELIIVKE